MPRSRALRAAIALRYRGRDLHVSKDEIVIGRSSECDVVLDSTLVSRRHARLTLRDGLVLEDLGSRNGVLVNSKPLVGPVQLRIGDVVSLGDETLEIIAQTAPAPEHAIQGRLRTAPTATNLSAITERPESENTRSATALELLAGVVDKALALGHGEDAERMLQLHLARLLEQAESKLDVSLDACSMAAHYGARLAAVTHKPAWLDYPIKLYAALDKPLPLGVVDEMFALMRKPSGIDLALLRAYVSSLRQRAAQLSPAERFALQRIEGLERLASL